MAELQKVVQRQQIEQQLAGNRAQLQEIEENLVMLKVQRKVVKAQIVAAKTALEGYDMGYTAAQAAQAETPPVENKEN